MYYYLKELKGFDIHVIGLDLKEDVIRRCSGLAKKYGYEKLHFLVGDIADYEGVNEVDVVVTLHACDTATDYALAKAIGWNAKVILSVPCCQHEVNGQFAKADKTQCYDGCLDPIMDYGLLRERFAALVTDGLRAKYLEAVNNTIEIAERCNVNIEFGKFKFPEYEIPSCVKTIEEFLRKLVYFGLSKRYPHGLTISVLERVEYELSVIEKMGYAAYFVVVWDFIDYAKRNRIPIGPGRGSAAGSLVAYALRITELDPLDYNLIFERFLNPERISMPDIDIDICQERRQEVIEYVIRKYGEDKVAQIITFGTMKARAAIRDVGRVMDTPLSKVDSIAKLVPFNATIQQTLNNVEEFKNFKILKEM